MKCRRRPAAFVFGFDATAGTPASAGCGFNIHAAKIVRQSAGLTGVPITVGFTLIVCVDC